MDIRIRTCAIVLLVSLTPLASDAGDHRFDAYIALSGLRTKGSHITLGGWHASGAATLGRNHPRWSLVADVSAHFLGGDGSDPQLKLVSSTGTQEVVAQPDRTQITFMAGPRFTPFKKFLLHGLFGHVLLFGAVHSAGGSRVTPAVNGQPAIIRVGGVTSGAVAFGLGWDPLAKAKKSQDDWTPRLQVDYVWAVSSDVPHGWRASIGIVRRFKFVEDTSPEH
jgi:hypothetical protein